MLVFPLRTFAVAGSLTILTSSLALLTAASKVDGRYPYNTATVRCIGPGPTPSPPPPRRSLSFPNCSSLQLPHTCCTSSSAKQHMATPTHPESHALPGACCFSSFLQCSIGSTTTCSSGHSTTSIHPPTRYSKPGYIHLPVPPRAQVLGNLKIATTALLFRLMLGRRVSVLQWLALLLLTTGTTVSQVRVFVCVCCCPDAV